MRVTLPKQTMYDGDLIRYASLLKIPDFRGVKMRDELPVKPHSIECGILNFNTHLQLGSHWTCWYKNGTTCYYFDSFGQIPPTELITYLTSPIHRSAVIVRRVWCSMLVCAENVDSWRKIFRYSRDTSATLQISLPFINCGLRTVHSFQLWYW